MTDDPAPLAEVAGRAVARALGTPAWDAVRDAAARLFARISRSPEPDVMDLLAGAAALVDRAGDPDAARAAAAGALSSALDDALARQPHADRDVRDFLRHLGDGHPGRAAGPVQVNTATGGGTVFAVQNGTQEITYPDAGGPR